MLEDHIRVNPLVIEEIKTCFERITIDRFATANNKICNVFNSYYLETSAWGVDAFAQTDYGQHTNYIFPPISLVGHTIQFMRENFGTQNFI